MGRHATFTSELDRLEFQPFTVPCVTCGSRLRVNRADLVGTIVTCPKCQSMVQLEPGSGFVEGAKPPVENPLPQPPVSMGREAVDSGALTEDSLAQMDLPEQVADSAGSRQVFVEPPPRPGEGKGQDAKDQDAKSQRGEGVSAEEGSADEGHGSLGTSSGAASPLPPDWQNARNAKSRRIALAVAVIAASIVSAFVVFNVIQKRQTMETAAETTTELANQDESNGLATESSADPTTPSSVDEDQTPAEKTATSEVSDAPAGFDNAAADDNAPAADDNAPVADNNAAPSLNDPATKDNASEPTGIPSGMLPQNPLLPDNPLEGLLPGPNSPFDVTSDPGDQVDADVPEMTQLPDDIRALLGPLDDLSRPHAVPTLEAPATLDEIQLDRAADEQVKLETVVKPRKPVNMRQAMGMRFWLSSTDPAGYPMNDLMLLISQWTRVPIEVEWVAFDLANSPINQRVELASGWMTVGDILTRACESADAEMIQEEASVRIQPLADQTSLALATLIDLSDLTDGIPNAVQTARSLLRQVDGDTSVVAKPDGSGMAQLAALVCESIRRSRGQAGKMSDVMAKRWVGPLREQASAWPLLNGGVSGQQIVHPLPLASLIKRLANQNGATCFIHWPDARKRRIGPADEQMPRMGPDVSAADVCDQVLSPEALQVRVADQKHWWLGSEASFDRLPVVVWFDNEKAPQAIEQKIASIIKDAFPNQDHFANVVVDPGSGKCIALLPRFIVRQLPRLLKQ